MMLLRKDGSHIWHIGRNVKRGDGMESEDVCFHPACSSGIWAIDERAYHRQRGILRDVTCKRCLKKAAHYPSRFHD